MDIATATGNIISFILSFIGALGVLFMFPLVILGIVLLVISVNKDEKSKKKFKFWGIVSLIFSVGLIVIPLILWVLLNTFLAI